MAKIQDVVKLREDKSLPPMQKRVLEEIEKRPGEVFAYKDFELLSRVPDFKPAGIDWSLWGLHQKGLVGKHKVKGGRTYFGTHAAIEDLRGQLGENIPHGKSEARGRRQRGSTLERTGRGGGRHA